MKTLLSLVIVVSTGLLLMLSTLPRPLIIAAVAGVAAFVLLRGRAKPS